MTSKSLFFKLLKEDFKIRVWTFVISCLTFFFSLIVATAMMVSLYLRDLIGFPQNMLAQNRIEFINTFKDFMGIENVLLGILFVGMSLLVAISGFAYLYSKKKVDFYHSLPVKRETIFWVKILNGIFIVLVPYIICAVVAVLIMSANVSGGSLMLPVLKAIFGWSALFLLNYFVAILAIMLTGNMLIGTFATGFFYFYFPLLAYMIREYQSRFFETYYSSGFVLSKLLPNTSSFIMTFNHNSFSAAARVIISLTASLILLFVNLFLYKKRASEVAGKSIAFNVIKLPIKFMIVIFIGMFMYILAYETMNDSNYWGIFAAVVSAVLTHSIMEIIYSQDFKKIFDKKVEMGICVLISLALVSIFELDILGYDRYLPKLNDIESAAVVSRLLETNQNQYYFKMNIWENRYADDRAEVETVDLDDIEADLFKKMDIEDKEAVLELARLCIAKEDNVDLLNSTTERVVISYKLKSGARVQRAYSVRYKLVATQLAAIYNGENFKKTMYPILSEDTSDIVTLDYNGIAYNDKHIVLDDEALKTELIETYKKELRNLKFEDREKSYPFASIRFNTAYMQKALDIYREQMNREYDVNVTNDNVDSSYANAMDQVGYYPIYPEFKETIAILKKLGADVVENLPVEEIDRITVGYLEPGLVEDFDAAENYIYESKTETFSDEKNIKEILDKLTVSDSPYEDIVNEDTDLSVLVFLKSDKEDAFAAGQSFYFKQGNLPDNVVQIEDKLK